MSSDRLTLDFSDFRWGSLEIELADLSRAGIRLSGIENLHLGRNNFNALPSDIAQLTQLQTLDLGENSLTELSPEIGQLTSLRSLRLGGNNLTELPPEIGQLTKLTFLDLDRNHLTELPPEIGQLTNLTTLQLDTNHLTELPPEIGQLTNLVTLDLRGNSLTELPPEIGQLTNLTTLQLDTNSLTELPPEIGQLTNLTILQLIGNHLTELPREIANVTKLTSLLLGRNNLTELPAVTFQLTNLGLLHLGESNVTQLPPEIARLTKLKYLNLDGNHLTELPPEIAELTKLQILKLAGNRLTKLSPSIANLTKLKTLDLERNHLTELPPKLSELAGLKTLKILGNPLNWDLQGAAEIGTPAVLRYLASLYEASAPVWQAKLLLVGEGEVGKSTLLSALLGEPFDAGRESTHGLEVKSVTVPNPTAEEDDIELFAWDFAGQPVYRPTHQIFFTTPALYIVVWKPRVGSQQSQVDYWLRMIRLRATEGSRALVVATHGGPANHLPDIQQAELHEAHGDLIAGFFHIDSEYPMEHDFPVLREAIAREVSQLPGVGGFSPRRWETARSIAEDINEPFVTLDQYAQRCASQGIDAKDATSVVQVSAVRGQWLFVGDERLPSPGDLVILKPQWLAKAISYVLDDQPTRDRHGILAESDLDRIWNSPNRDQRYPAHLYPAFIRLMERYDLAYRVVEPETKLGDRERSWLIAQLVAENPDRERLDTLQAEGREASVIALTFDGDTGKAELAEGLIYRLIVRFNSWSLGVEDHAQSLHWSSGVVLQDRRWGHAIVRTRPNGIYIKAIGLSPETMINIIVNDVERLCTDFWPGLRVEVAVPCLSNCGLGEPGRSSIQLEKLLQLMDAEITQVPCSDNACNSLLSVDELLGRRAANGRTVERLNELIDRLERHGDRVELVLDELATFGMNAETIFGVVENALQSQTRLNDELYDLYGNLDGFLGRILSAVVYDLHGPNLIATYDLEPENPARKLTGSRDLRAVLYCEHSKQPVWVLEGDREVGRYTFTIDGKVMAKIRPYAKVIGVILPRLSALARSSFEAQVKPETWAEFRDEANLLDRSFSLGASVISMAADSADYPGISVDFGSASNAARSVLVPLIKSKDPGFAGLKPVVDSLTKKVVWVHAQFANLYQSYETPQVVQ